MFTSDGFSPRADPDLIDYDRHFLIGRVRAKGERKNFSSSSSALRFFSRCFRRLEDKNFPPLKHGEEEKKKKLHLAGSCAAPSDSLLFHETISFRTAVYTLSHTRTPKKKARRRENFVLSHQKKFFHMTTPYLMKIFFFSHGGNIFPLFSLSCIGN